jgi:DNA-3-methyladenine glycosylase I
MKGAVMSGRWRTLAAVNRAIVACELCPRLRDHCERVAREKKRAYHDQDWARPVHEEQELLERICLEGFQAGLSWLTILTKRPAFRVAFANFVPEDLAAYQPADVERLLRNPGIVRNRAKIQAAIANARATLAIRERGGLERLVWSHRPLAAPGAADLVPSDAPEARAQSKALSRTLRASGFSFVGPTTAHALMEATGMVNGHVPGCHRNGDPTG